MDQELDVLYTQNTWDVVPKPKGRKIVESRWVFKLKRDTLGKICQYKARLVAQGFFQQLGLDFDEVFSPIVKYDSLRLLLALIVHYYWRPQQLYIKYAFLYKVLKEEIYMQLPEGSR